MPTLSVVSPVYKEGAAISVFLDALEKVLGEIGDSYEIILVDDGSPDDSWQHMQREAASRGAVRCLRLSRNFGKEAALAAGLNAAAGDAVITLDSDMQHPPSLIPVMVAAWKEGKADIIEARKERRQTESRLDRCLATLFYRAFFWISTFDLSGASDFKLLDRKVVEAWQNLPERKMFYRGMTYWLGFRRMELPFTPAAREAGGTKWSFAKKFRLALDSMTAYTSKPLYLIWLMGLLFFVFSVVMGGEALVMKLRGQAMDGFTTVILLILITGSAILASICLLAIYLRQVFHEVKRRPRYIISERAGGAENTKSRARKADG